MLGRALALVLVALLGRAGVADGAPLGVVVFHNSTEGYHTFRLPTLVVTPSHLVMLAEGRARDGFAPPAGDTADCFGEGASAADWRCTNKDVVLKRSADGGKTWDAARALALANASFFYTNPQGLFDAARGAVWLLYMRCVAVTGGGDAFVNCTTVLSSSVDAGATFGAPVDVGPVQTSSGGFGGLVTAAGRLIFAAPSNAKTGCVFSDDGGATWTWGAPPTPSSGENSIAELADGTLLMTARHKNNSRSLARSADGGATWAPNVLMNVTDPNCQASLLAVTTAGARAASLLFANPHTSGLLPYAVGRQNVTVQVSHDDGASFVPLLLVDDGPSAYTALAQLAPAGAGPRSCGVAYEESADLPVDFRSIRFVAFDCVTGAVE